MLLRSVLVLAALACPLPAARAAAPAIVPNPESLVAREGAFTLRPQTPLAADRGGREAARWFASLVARTHQVELPLRGTAAPRAIAFRLDPRADARPESYRVEVHPEGVIVTAASAVGLVHGATTLWQMVARTPSGLEIPAAAIDDAPRFAWRGILLDSARHYQSPAFIRGFIDWMAAHKLNVLHWHLTDDQAWRLEIRKYPRLTSVGAWRVPAGAAAREDLDPATGKPRRHGGFYSQATVRALVAYAAARGITIVPEIDMPGHATAAAVAYPWLSAAELPPTEVPADWGVYANVYSLEERTFRFVEDVLTEVMALFPGRYVHVGGDEVQTHQWTASAQARARMRALGIEDPARLQPYFTQRVGRFLQGRGRRLVGWDEILEPGIPADAVVMSWRGIDGALAAAAKGHDTVLAAHPTLYFDNRQTDARDEPPGRVRVVSLRDVYAFEPMPAGIAPERRRHVLGLQGNVWTEHIRTEARVAHMAFPRAAAVAELGWSQPHRRDWGDFERRMGAMRERYRLLGMPGARRAVGPAPIDGAGEVRTAHDLRLCSEHIAIDLEDDAPLQGERAVFRVDVQNPCWIFPAANLERARALTAGVGQVPFNFQIGEDVKKIRFPAPITAEGELEVRLGCEGEVLARLPLAPATGSHGVTRLPPVAIEPRAGRHDLCLRFAQPRLDPLWVIDAFAVMESAP